MNLQSIDAEALLILYRQGLSEIGAEIVAHDPQLLDAALSFPFLSAVSGTADVATLATAYAIGMLEYRPFVSGNGRAAFLAMGLFLYLNDWRLGVSQEEATTMMRGLMSGETDEEEFANWIRQNL